MNDKLNRRDLLKLAGMGTRSRPRRYVGICATGDVDTDPGAGRQFTPLLIFATNIDPKELVDDAFLRRIGYGRMSRRRRVKCTPKSSKTMSSPQDSFPKPGSSTSSCAAMNTNSALFADVSLATSSNDVSICATTNHARGL